MLGLKLNHVSKRGPWRFGMNQHIATETKWQLCHTRHFQMYFIDLKVSYFPKGAIDNSQRWFRYWLGAKQATNHYLNQSWHRLPTHICVTRLCELLLKQKQNNYHVGEYICKYIFFMKKFKRSETPIYYHWFRSWRCANQATSHYRNQWWPCLLTHICTTRLLWVSPLYNTKHLSKYTIVSKDPRLNIQSIGPMPSAIDSTVKAL